MIKERQQELKEPLLQCFTNTPGKGICNLINSFHSWRSAGKSRVSQPTRHNETNPTGTQKATKDEVYSYGRWLIKRKQEAIAHQYNQWDLLERIPITKLYS